MDVRTRKLLFQIFLKKSLPEIMRIYALFEQSMLKVAMQDQKYDIKQACEIYRKPSFIFIPWF